MPDKDYSIKYTENAHHQLEEFKLEQAKKLEDLILEEKYVIGDEIVEITGSDIQQAKKRIVVLKSKKLSESRYFMLRTVSRFYIALGLLITIGGLSYEFFEEMIAKNRLQFQFVIMGFAIAGMGVFTLFYIRLREKRAKSEELENETNKITNIVIENFYKDLK